MQESKKDYYHSLYEVATAVNSAGEPYHFTEDDIHFVSAVANLGAIALENAKRYHRLQEGYEDFRRLTF